MSIEAVSIEQNELDFAAKNHIRKEAIMKLEEKDNKYSSEFYNSFINILGDLELPENIVDENGEILEENMQKILSIFMQINKANADTENSLKNIKKWLQSAYNISELSAFNCVGASFLLYSLLKEKYKLKDLYIGNPAGHAVLLFKYQDGMYYLDARNNRMKKFNKEDYSDYPSAKNIKDVRLGVIKMNNKSVYGFSVIPFYSHLSDAVDAITSENNQALNGEFSNGYIEAEDYEKIVRSYGGKEKFESSLLEGKDVREIFSNFKETAAWGAEKYKVEVDGIIIKNIGAIMTAFISKNPENINDLTANKLELRRILKDLFKCKNEEDFLKLKSNNTFTELLLATIFTIDRDSFFQEVIKVQTKIEDSGKNIDDEIDRIMDELKK